MISIDSFHDGGAEMFAVRLANGLADIYEVHFMEYRANASIVKAQKRLLNKKIKFFSPEESFFFKIAARIIQHLGIISLTCSNRCLNYCLYRSIRKYIGRNKIETVNSHAIENNSALTRVKHIHPDLKLVLSLHGHYELYRRNYDAMKFNALISDHITGFDTVIFTTRDQYNTFIEFGLKPSKAKRIFYGFHFESDNKIKPFKKGDILNLILISRAIPEKGWAEAIHAVVNLNKRGCIVKLLLVGQGPFLSNSATRDFPDYIKFAGYIDNVFPLINETHIGLLPTYYVAESLPNAIIEYLSCGKPVIASNIGAIADMLEYRGEIAGELIKAERGKPVNVEELMILIQKYIDSSEYYAFKANLALKAAEKFKLTHCIAEYQSII